MQPTHCFVAENLFIIEGLSLQRVTPHCILSCFLIKKNLEGDSSACKFHVSVEMFPVLELILKFIQNVSNRKDTNADKGQ